MSAQVYSVPGKTEGRRKAFLEWTSIVLSSKLSLTCGGNVNYYKMFIILFLLCLWGYGTPWQFSKQISKLSFQLLSSYVLLLTKLKGGGRLFLEGARWGVTLRDYLQEHLGVTRDEKPSPFVKFEIILPHLCFLLDLTNKHCRTWSSMINLCIDSRTCQK